MRGSLIYVEHFEESWDKAANLIGNTQATFVRPESRSSQPIEFVASSLLTQSRRGYRMSTSCGPFVVFFFLYNPRLAGSPCSLENSGKKPSIVRSGGDELSATLADSRKPRDGHYPKKLLGDFGIRWVFVLWSLMSFAGKRALSVSVKACCCSLVLCMKSFRLT